MRLFAASTTLFAALLPLGGCAAGTPWVELRGQRIPVEVADDHDERQRGLMFRDQLPASTGMLFVHERSQPLAYWMKNTRIPLDILYFDADRKLVSMSRNVPPCSLGDRCPPYPSRAPGKYVLELNAGEAAALGVQDGDVLVFSDGIPDTGAP